MALVRCKIDEQALFWYTQAAEQNYAPAQTNVGAMYEFGRGVEQDYVQAALWYEKAAYQKMPVVY